MCTLSWLRHDDGYAVFFNRDERRTRVAGLPPQEQLIDGVRVLAPIDPEGGGSWASVNDRRIGLCILNQYDAPRSQVPGQVSRGRLLLSLAPVTSQAGVWQSVRSSGLAQYAPFRLAVFEPALPALLLSWDGDRLTDEALGQSGLLAASSSLVQRDAEASRRALFERTLHDGTADSSTFEALHRSHLPEKGALSVCMHREDAATVSLTRIVADRSSVLLGYVGGPPCEGGLEIELVAGLVG